MTEREPTEEMILAGIAAANRQMPYINDGQKVLAIWKAMQARATPALPQGEPEPVAMFCRAEHSGDLGLQWNPDFDPYEGALLYSGPPKPQALPQGDEYKHAKCPGHAAYVASQALPQVSSYGFLHVLYNTEGLSGNRPEIQHSFSSISPFGRAGIDYDASFAHHSIPLDSALHRPALPQGLEEAELEQDLRYRIEAGIVLLEMVHPNLETLIETLRRCAEAIKRPALPEGMAIVPAELLQLISEAAYTGLRHARAKNDSRALVWTNAIADLKGLLAAHAATASQGGE